MITDSGLGAMKRIVGGGLLLAVAVYLYFYLAEFEAAGESRPMHVLIAMPYQMGGKWLTCGVFAALGLFGLRYGIKEWRDQHRPRPKELVEK